MINFLFSFAICTNGGIDLKCLAHQIKPYNEKPVQERIIQEQRS